MKKELKVGILALVVLVATFFVINYLRGKEVFDREYQVESFYEDLQGLLPSSPVYIKGYQAGTVTDLVYDKERFGFKVICTVSRDFAIPEDSRMTIYSADLMGGKAVRIDLGTSQTMAQDGAYLQPSVSADMLSSIAAGIEPIIRKGKEVLERLDTALINLNHTISDENRATLRSMLVGLDQTVAQVENIVSSVGERTPEIENFICSLDSLSLRLNVIAGKVDSTMDDVAQVAGELSQADIEALVSGINSLVEKLQDSEGTIGRLVNDDAIYNSVDSLIFNIDSLVKKISENPKKYFKITVF